MSRILAIVFLLVFIWVATPHVRAGEWIAPTAISPDSWLQGYDRSGYAASAANPTRGYGWFHFDFWNHDRMPQGRQVYRSDFRI